MSGASMELSIDDLHLKKRVKALMTAFTSGLGIPFKAFGVHMLHSVKLNFLEEGRPKKWARHSQATIESRLRSKGRFKRHKKGTRKGRLTSRAVSSMAKLKILTVSAMLQNSVAVRILRDALQIGTNLIYAAIQQKGGKAGRGKKVTIPARPYLLFQTDDIRIAKLMIEDYLTGAWRRGA